MGDDMMVWPNTLSGDLTSRDAYDLLRAPLLRNNWANWIWGTFIPQYRSTTIWRAIRHWEGLAWLGRRFVPCATLVAILWIIYLQIFTCSILNSITHIFDVTLFYDFGFHHVLKQATRCTFSPLMWNLWRLTFVTTIWANCRARNKRIMIFALQLGVAWHKF